LRLGERLLSPDRATAGLPERLREGVLLRLLPRLSLRLRERLRDLEGLLLRLLPRLSLRLRLRSLLSLRGLLLRLLDGDLLRLLSLRERESERLRGERLLLRLGLLEDPLEDIKLPSCFFGFFLL